MSEVRYVPGTNRPQVFGPLARIAPAVGLVLAYGMVVPLKLAGYLPPTVDWAGVVLVPAIWMLALGSLVMFPVQTRRGLWINLGFTLVCLVVGVAAVAWQGWV